MIRTVDFRFNVLRNDAIVSELTAVSAPILRMDNSGDIKMSMSGDFEVNTAVNWLHDEVQPVMIIDGVETPLAVLLPATVSYMTDETSHAIHAELYDRCWKTKDSLTESIIHLAAGLNYIEAVKQLLLQAGITLVQSTPTEAVLAEAREDWDIGTSRLAIINQLLSEINYNPLWFNFQGMAILEPASVPRAENIDHVLDASDIRSLVLPTVSREMDIFDAPNVFICVCSNADKTGPLVATAENTNPQSPLSIPSRGRRIARVFRVDNIADADELQLYANRLRNNSMIGAEVIEIETALHPGYGAYDVTAVSYDEISAICAETAWEMELQTGGTMKHRMERVVYAF